MSTLQFFNNYSRGGFLLLKPTYTIMQNQETYHGHNDMKIIGTFQDKRTLAKPQVPQASESRENEGHILPGPKHHKL